MSRGLLLVVLGLYCGSVRYMATADGGGDDYGCNEFVCGSVVSKCLLTQSCQCKLSDCYCCKDCLNCLGDLYTECCSCLDMCPKHNETLGALAPKSQIGDFEGVPELFDTLTAEDDDDQWTTLRFPMRAGLKQQQQQHHLFGGDEIDRQATLQKTATGAAGAAGVTNCTVIYLNTCTTNKKCAQYCESMGSNSYRWFHDGCCECVGANCFNYGINESRCAACPEEEDDQDQEDGMNGFEGDGEDEYGADDEQHDMMGWDFGEDEFNYN